MNPANPKGTPYTRSGRTAADSAAHGGPCGYLMYMRYVEFLRIILLMSVLVRISPAHASEEIEMAEHPARQSSRDVKIPVGLVARIEKDYREYVASLQMAPQTQINRKLLNISVELTQKRPAALHQDGRVLTPLGGGVIDLEDLVTPLRGGFKVHIKATKEKNVEPNDLRIFFISNAKARQIDGDEYGAGCDKYMEVTGAFHRAMSAGGFEVYTAEQRYVSVLGGTFIMTSFDKEALHVGGVTFIDGRHPDLLCEGI